MIHLISSRWTPHHIERRDSERGTYEEVNPPIGQDDARLQSVLIEQRRHEQRDIGRVLFAVIAIGAALYLAWKFK